MAAQAGNEWLLNSAASDLDYGLEMPAPERRNYVSDQIFKLEPPSVAIDQSSLTAQIRLDRAADCWDVTVIFSRPPQQPPIQGADVDVQLFDREGSDLNLLERPSRAFVEFGGSLGVSASAVFKFQNHVRELAELRVTYQGQTASFRLNPSH